MYFGMCASQSKLTTKISCFKFAIFSKNIYLETHLFSYKIFSRVTNYYDRGFFDVIINLRKKTGYLLMRQRNPFPFRC